jgi:hypothetical protein
MNKILYFSGAISLDCVTAIDNKKFESLFPGVKGMRCDSFTKHVGRSIEAGELLPVTRIIEYKRNPSRHECNARCLNGSCTGVCECKCGGRNHGLGSLLN